MNSKYVFQKMQDMIMLLSRLLLSHKLKMIYIVIEVMIEITEELKMIMTVKKF